MPDDKQPKQSFWNPRVDPSTIKPAETITFSRPRPYDYSGVAWDRKDFWYQKEPMTECYYLKKQDGKDKK
ncbi:hypothetical protein MAM1_0002d00268 [Mucor ambiguus]|uniref:Uncharacterized protein n=1 Tax=Mucor ambiguus TaxID=91626 RepID=A0A0C9M3W4_9FUNG|nr:hypothetical protein MAM1_0002d00268 [Mucor ambiguus]